MNLDWKFRYWEDYTISLQREGGTLPGHCDEGLGTDNLASWLMEFHPTIHISSMIRC